MGRFLLKRGLQAIPLIFGITFLSFLILQLAPGDYFTRLKLDPEVSPQIVEKLREEFGLDKGPLKQYFLWLWGAVRGNFGYSMHYKIPVLTLIKSRLVNTLILSLASLILSWGISLPLGMYCALHQYSWKDNLLSLLAFVGLCIPNFFLAFLLLFFASRTGWLPTGGMTSVWFDSLSLAGKIKDIGTHLLIPMVVVGTSSMAGLVRLMRGNMLEVLRRPFITALRAKGIPEGKLIRKHAFRNAVNPMITLFGFSLSGLFSGAALTEMITQWPGLGYLMLQAVRSQDLYVIMADLLIASLLLVGGNLLADLLLAVVDPRIRYQR